MVKKTYCFVLKIVSQFLFTIQANPISYFIFKEKVAKKGKRERERKNFALYVFCVQFRPSDVPLNYLYM